LIDDAQPPAILIEGVTKRFRDKTAVDGLDLVVPTGSVCGFLGPNGAGKSTTIRMIMSIIYPDQGELNVLGSSAIRHKDLIGYLPEERGVYRKMKVGPFLEYLAMLKGMDRTGLKQKVQDWLDRVDLKDVYKRKCEELSKGMQQKVQFLAAIIHDPELIILDEPFSGLDPVNAELLNRLIREQHDAGKTIIFSTHVLHQAEQICDRIFLINHGVKLLDASLDEIRERFDPRTMIARPLNGTAPERIDGLPGVEATRTMSDAQGDGLELALAEDADARTIMRELLDRSAWRSMELRRPTLEDVFVQLVQQDQGEEAAAQAREELSHG
jgi:ABC-2 type transport system ATP-binding protein